MYPYQPIENDAIRLLDFSIPGIIRFQVASLQSEAIFDALSYCWGTKDERYDVEIDGNKAPVYSNLYSLLQELKARSYRGRLWVDALCIDQSSQEEKGHQIPNMREVYSKAQRVIIWLGIPSEHLDKFMRGLPSFVRSLKQKIESIPNVAVDTQISRQYLLWDFVDMWVLCFEFMLNPWFSRLWTLQEVLLAMEVEIWSGSHTVSWDELTFLSKKAFDFDLHGFIHGAWMELNGYVQAKRGLSAPRVLDTLKASLAEDPERSLPISYLTRECRLRESFEPNDKVYGLMGLVHPTIREEWREWIQTPHHPRDTYIRLMRQILPGEPGLLLLSDAQMQHEMPGLPSWCIDFGSYTNQNWSPGMIGGFSAAGKRINELYQPQYTNQIRLDSNLNIIGITGLEVDVVQTVIEPDWILQVSGSVIPALNAKQCLNWETRCLTLAQEIFQCSSHVVPEEHWRTLCADRTSTLSAVACPSNTLRQYLNWKGHMQALASMRETDFLDCDDFYTMFSELWPEHSYFSTTSGRIGIALKARPGDRVCILRWSIAPFILRQKERGASATYELIGDAYVHGIMYGELADQVNSLEETFVLV